MMDPLDQFRLNAYLKRITYFYHPQTVIGHQSCGTHISTQHVALYISALSY